MTLTLVANILKGLNRIIVLVFFAKRYNDNLGTDKRVLETN